MFGNLCTPNHFIGLKKGLGVNDISKTKKVTNLLVRTLLLKDLLLPFFAISRGDILQNFDIFCFRFGAS